MPMIKVKITQQIKRNTLASELGWNDEMEGALGDFANIAVERFNTHPSGHMIFYFRGYHFAINKGQFNFLKGGSSTFPQIRTKPYPKRKHIPVGSWVRFLKPYREERGFKGNNRYFVRGRNGNRVALDGIHGMTFEISELRKVSTPFKDTKTNPKSVSIFG